MARKANFHYVETNVGSKDEGVQAPVPPQLQQPSASSLPVKECASEKPVEQEPQPAIQLVPAAHRLYKLFLKLDKKRVISDEKFNKICLITGGDKRRIIHRVILGLYQHAHKVKDDEEIKRARLMLALHESEILELNLEAL